jgi:hypothetical protein
MVPGLGLRVYNLGLVFRAYVSGFRVQDVGFRV